MCGRYSLYSSKMDYENALEAAGGLSYAGTPIDMEPDFNISPYRNAPLPFVTPAGIEFGLWGLVPDGNKKPLNELRYTFNAKVETIAKGGWPWKGPTARHQFCLVPMSGFYEWQWQDDGKTKVRHLIRLQNPATFACAGLWNDWTSSEGRVMKSFTIITCPANRLMEKIHNPPEKLPRMPVILTGEKASAWIDGAGSFTRDEALEFLRPLPDDELFAYPVENKAKGAALIKPIGEPVTA